MHKILKLAYYRNYCTDSNQILHSDNDHQTFFVGGLNIRKANQDDGRPPSKNRKMAISPKRLDWSVEIWHGYAHWHSEPYWQVKFPHFQKLQMADSRVAVLTEKEPERSRMVSALARAYIGGLGAEPLAGSRGRAPGQGARGRSPPEAESFLVAVHPTERPKLRF